MARPPGTREGKVTAVPHPPPGCGGLGPRKGSLAGRRTPYATEGEYAMRWPPWKRPDPVPEANHTGPIPDHDRVFPNEAERRRAGYPYWAPLLGEWVTGPDRPDDWPGAALTGPTDQFPFVTPAQELRGRGDAGGPG